MADPHHHHDPIEDNIDTHPVKLAIWIAIGAVALIVGIYLLVQLAVYAYSERSQKNNAAMSDGAVKKRIAPAAQLAMDPNAEAAAPAAGKATYDSVCHVCHGAGVAGAPKLGDKAAWAPRIKQGAAALHANAMKGKGAMPPKGGNPSLSDADVAAAVDYMVSAAK